MTVRHNTPVDKCVGSLSSPIERRQTIVHDPVISDHLAMHCQLAFTKPPFEKKEIHYRKLRSIDKTAFLSGNIEIFFVD